MLLWNPCISDSRVIKEAESLARGGYEVRVFCVKDRRVPDLETRNGVTYERVISMGRRWSLRFREAFALAWPPAGSGGQRRWSAFLREFPLSVAEWLFITAKGVLNRVFRYTSVTLRYRAAVERYRPGAIHAHDLITFPAGVRLGARLGVPVICDVHDLALYAANAPRGLERMRQAHAERKYLRRAAGVITVSDSIAAHLAASYGIARPVIIYNAPAVAGEGWTRDVRSDAGLAGDVPLMAYVGGLSRGRGIELVVSSLRHAPALHLVAIGPRHADYERRLKAQAVAEGTADRLHFVDPVPSHVITRHLRTADVGVIAYQNICLNHEYCMPNKLFECALAGVPLAVANLTDLRTFVTRLGIGLVMDETDPRSIAGTAMRICGESARWRADPERVRALAAEYGWGAQERKLLELYRSVLDAA